MTVTYSTANIYSCVFGCSVVPGRLRCIACKEMLRQNKEGCIIYFHVCNDTRYL